MRRNSATIDAFVHAQRQNVASSPIIHHSAHLSGPEVDVHYTNHGGQEIIQVDPKLAPSEGVTPEQAVAILDAVATVTPELLAPPPKRPPVKDVGPVLMVLFQDNGIAAFPMSSLGPGSIGAATFKARSRGSQWTSTPGEIVQVGQLKLGGIGWILTQLDLSAQGAAGNLMLSTTKLKDAVATGADVQALPLMAWGAGSVLFTTGGAYDLDQHNGIQARATMAVDNGVPVVPQAIGADGTCYYFPSVQGSFISVTIDPTSVRAYPDSPNYDDALSAQERAQYGTVVAPNVYAVTLSNEVTHDHPISVPPSQDRTLSYKIALATTDGFKWSGYTDGVTSFGMASFGGPPLPAYVRLTQSTRDVSVYDIGVNHTVIKQTAQSQYADFNGAFPLQAYTYDGSSDTIDVKLFPVVGSGSTTNPITQNTDKTGFGSLLTALDDFDVSGTETHPNGVDDQQTTSTSAGNTPVPGVTFAPIPASGPGGAYTPSDALTAFATWSSQLGSLPGITGQTTFTATDLVTHINYDNGSPATATAAGDFSDFSQAPFPGGCMQVSVYGNNQILASAAVDKHIPYFTGSSGSGFRARNNIQVFGDTLSYTYDSTFGTNPAPPAMSVHAFPPALGSSHSDPVPYRTRTDGTQFTVATPYATHPATGMGSFTPWLHLSNGAHVIQAYYVDTTPHAFVDGSPAAGLLDRIAQQCGCRATEIVAMFMDISLASVKALTGVQPPDYSGSVAPAPPVPGH